MTILKHVWLDTSTTIVRIVLDQGIGFYHKDLLIERVADDAKQCKPEGNADQLQFGHHYSDHMMDVDWTAREGWGRPLICPLREIKLHPGAKVLHYAVEIYEGMKAFRGVDDRIRLFRPEMNMSRMKKSATRAAMPNFDSEELLKLITELVRLDRDWVPTKAPASLYIRPSLIGTDPVSPVESPRSVKLFVLTGPVGMYFPVTQPVSLYADPSVVRAFPGGVGGYKMGCNYAPTIAVGELASEHGCQQVLWLFGKDELLTEVGAMNIFIYWKNELGEMELVTPPLDDGLIMPGVSRDSVLTLAREWDEFRVSERYPTMRELRKAIDEQRLFQIFGSGTACAVSPVGRILYRSPGTGQMDELLIPTISSGANYGKVIRADWTRVVA
uniref:Branched-chain-amino-acid aminotransferase n=1 Tax=Globodera rostochiensis TaxID=31243 RepID=A0A914GS79_GLORO